MSDQRSGGDVTSEDETENKVGHKVGHKVEDAPAATDETGAEAAKSPSPRPRSAASRARRIGGAATPSPAAKADSAKGDIPAEAAALSPTSKPTTAKPTGKTTGRVSTDKVSTAKPSAKRDADTAAEPDSDADEAQPAKRFTVALPGWSVWTPTVLFAAVAVVFLTLFVVAQFGDDSDTTSSKTRQEVLAAAKTCLATLNTYRYDKIDDAEAAGVKCTTAKLTSDYRKTVTSVIRAKAPALKAVQLAKINSAGIESVTKNGKQWTVLAYGQLNITTSQQKQGRVDPFAVVARLQQVDGKWLLSKIDTVSSFSS